MRNNGTAPITNDAPSVGGLMALPASIFQRAQKDADQMDPKPLSPAGELAYVTAEIRDLRAEVERLRAERDRLLEVQSEVLGLLGTDRPDRLLHDLRNVLHERALYRALAETVM
jgi:hypothetical protein